MVEEGARVSKIILYHYSDKKLDKISTEFFGANSYTFNDKKYNIKRSFFYTQKNSKEYHLDNCQYIHTVSVDSKDIYDLILDRDNLKEKFIDISELLEYLKANYLGVLYKVSYEIVCLFKEVSVDNIITIYKKGVEMKRFIIIYGFKNGKLKGENEYELEAENEKNARIKLKNILSAYKSLKIKKIIEID